MDFQFVLKEERLSDDAAGEVTFGQALEFNICAMKIQRRSFGILLACNRNQTEINRVSTFDHDITPPVPAQLRSECLQYNAESRR